ncbi:Longitudinals lacking protein, isoforms H/M/V [Armadillidium vulgare]|nr:Longitudinals lacking protein, isoforms H/M/V [Armadillidium vulgare]
MNDEELALKWNNHQSTFLQIIKCLRYKDMFADATLACNGKFFSVHKLVLSACSDYFGDIFYEARGQNPVIILKDIDCKNLEYLLDYMYVGEINVKQKELASLVNVAECLKIKGLAVPDDTPQMKSFDSNDINNSDSNREHNQENSTENFFQNFSEENSFLKTVNSDMVSENISNDTPLHYDVKVEPLEPGLEAEVDNGNKISDFGFLNNLNTNCEDELERNYSCKENVNEERIRLLNFGGPCTPFSSFQLFVTLTILCIASTVKYEVALRRFRKELLRPVVRTIGITKERMAADIQ